MKKEKTAKRNFILGVLILSILMIPLPQLEVKAASNYYIQINKGTNVVTVFTGDGTPVKAFICSVGEDTPTGTFYTSQRLRWHELKGPTYGQYCTRITGHILFHSVWYYVKDNLATQSYREYNKLGTTASHGCVRLTVQDAKWIYDNCSLRTKVVIINGKSKNDPLGKPEFTKVSTSQRMGWDPTDPASGNPYAKLMPTIQAPKKTVKITYGTKFKALSGIKAKDSLGNSITKKLTYKGKVNTKKVGEYTVTYSVKDALGRTVSKSVTYQVVDKKKATISGVESSLTQELNSTVKLKEGVTAKTTDKKDLTKKIKIKIIYPGTTEEKSYTKSSLKLTQTGTYKIYYYVTNPNNKKVTKKCCKIKVTEPIQIETPTETTETETATEI